MLVQGSVLNVLPFHRVLGFNFMYVRRNVLGFSMLRQNSLFNYYFCFGALVFHLGF